MEIIVIVLSNFMMSTAIFVFWVARGGFNRRYLYTDNLLLGLTGSVISLIIYKYISITFWLLIPFLSGFILFVLFIFLFLYRFFRDPKRVIPGGPDDIVSGADGRIIYIKELEANQIPVTVKKMRISSISEITKTDVLQQPCYLIGIAMTLFDVHMNRAPMAVSYTHLRRRRWSRYAVRARFT